ncbi:MAG: hypothetical protein EOO48_01360, partial [Flavobacterium sp.]
MQVSESGPLVFQISQTNTSGGGIDVDFIAWGPFTAPSCGGSNLNPSTQVGCSYSTAAIENFTIPNAQAGQYYMLLITNFSNQPGSIVLTQTNGSAPGHGATDCNIVCPLSITGVVPPCPTTLLTAVYLNASAPTFQWYNSSGPILGETGPSYSASVPGDYTVVANSPGCYANASVTVTVPAPTPAPVTQQPVDLSKCGPLPVSFNLNSNNEAFMGLNPTDYSVGGYFHSTSDAELGIGAIPNPSTYSGTDGEIIYIRIDDVNGGCVTVVSFVLHVVDCGPISPGPQEVCDDASNNGTEIFNLDALIPTILGTHVAADYNITFHLTQADADNDTGAISPSNAYAGGPNQTIYIRMEQVANPTLFDTNTFTLIVHPQPATPNPSDVTVCDSYTLPALPAGQTYHDTTATGTVIPPLTVITGTKTIWIVAESGTVPNCTAQGDFVVTVNQTPVAPNPPDVTACDSYTLPALPAGQTYHDTTVGGAVIAPLTAITSTKTIWIVAATGTTPNCSSSGDFVVTINNTPPAPTPSNVTVCDSYTLPALPAGQTYHDTTAAGPVIPALTAITSTKTIVIVAETGTTPNCSSSGSFVVTVNQTPVAPSPSDVTACDSYTLPALPAGQTYHDTTVGGALITPLTAITSTKTIWIVAETGTTPNCSSSGDFVVTINNTPPAPTPSNVTVCDSYTLPALPAGQTYHDTTAAGPVIPALTAITSTKTVVIVAETGTTPNCSSSGSFVVTVNQTPVAPNPSDVTACDSYTLPALPAGQTYHDTTVGGAVIAPLTAITSTKTIWIVAETGTNPNCSSSGDFVVTINNTPPAPTPSNVTVCDSYTLPALPAGQTYHDTTAAGPVIPALTAITSTKTIVIVAETGTTPNCSSSGSFLLTINPTPIADNPADVVACDSYTLPVAAVGHYYSAPNGGGTILDGTAITTTQTV